MMEQFTARKICAEHAKLKNQLGPNTAVCVKCASRSLTITVFGSIRASALVTTDTF